jgi:hypothetical protein
MMDALNCSDLLCGAHDTAKLRPKLLRRLGASAAAYQYSVPRHGRQTALRASYLVDGARLLQLQGMNAAFIGSLRPASYGGPVDTCPGAIVVCMSLEGQSSQANRQSSLPCRSV